VGRHGNMGGVRWCTSTTRVNFPPQFFLDYFMQKIWTNPAQYTPVSVLCYSCVVNHQKSFTVPKYRRHNLAGRGSPVTLTTKSKVECFHGTATVVSFPGQSAEHRSHHDHISTKKFDKTCPVQFESMTESLHSNT